MEGSSWADRAYSLCVTCRDMFYHTWFECQAGSPVVFGNPPSSNDELLSNWRECWIFVITWHFTILHAPHCHIWDISLGRGSRLMRFLLSSLKLLPGLFKFIYTRGRFETSFSDPIPVRPPPFNPWVFTTHLITHFIIRRYRHDPESRIPTLYLNPTTIRARFHFPVRPSLLIVCKSGGVFFS